MSKRIPAYCLHKASGQAYVKLDGKRLYLGKHGSPESHQRYVEEISKWQVRQTEATQDVTSGQLSVLYLKRSEWHYRKGDCVTSEMHCVRAALKHVNRQYRNLPAREFTPMMLEQVHRSMIESKLARTTINAHVSRIVRCWKWGGSQGLVPVAVYQALTTLQGLQQGRSEARESDPVSPVPLVDVMAIESHLRRPLWGAVMFQLHTAARPGEALTARLCDIDRSGAVWIYRPVTWKTQHHGKGRAILIGPRGQALLKEFITTADSEAYLFAVPASKGKKAYRRDSYTLAIRRACDRVNGVKARADRKVAYSKL